jgi:NADH-quinone oxidoreductase subunit E
MEAPDVEAATDSHESTNDSEVATEATKDQAAPAPSADVPAKPNEPETDPDATDSKT